MHRTEELSSESLKIWHDVPPAEDGTRLDVFLKKNYRKRSREQLKSAIQSGAIQVIRNQGAHLSVGSLKPSSTLLSGDIVEVRSERKPEPEVSFDYKILFEDDDILVIDKPGNLPVHPAGKYFFNTLLIHLRTNHFQNPLHAEREYFLVHRIDKETSGVILLAKNKEVCANLVDQFFQRETQKKYIAIVHGDTPEEFTVDRPLKRDLRSLIKLKMTVTDGEDGLSALTRFKKIGGNSLYSILECYPKTGRQHQIRAHLASEGFPIVGDKLYSIPDEQAIQFYEQSRDSRGRRKPGQRLVHFDGMRRLISPELRAKLVLDRHALHAAELSFQHPRTKKMVTFTSPLPEVFRSIVPLPKLP